MMGSADADITRWIGTMYSPSDAVRKRAIRFVGVLTTTFTMSVPISVPMSIPVSASHYGEPMPL